MCECVGSPPAPSVSVRVMAKGACNSACLRGGRSVCRTPGLLLIKEVHGGAVPAAKGSPSATVIASWRLQDRIWICDQVSLIDRRSAILSRNILRSAPLPIDAGDELVPAGVSKPPSAVVSCRCSERVAVHEYDREWRVRKRQDGTVRALDPLRVARVVSARAAGDSCCEDASVTQVHCRKESPLQPLRLRPLVHPCQQGVLVLPPSGSSAPSRAAPPMSALNSPHVRTNCVAQGYHWVWVLVDLADERLEYWDSYHGQDAAVVVRQLGEVALFPTCAYTPAVMSLTGVRSTDMVSAATLLSMPVRALAGARAHPHRR